MFKSTILFDIEKKHGQWNTKLSFHEDFFFFRVCTRVCAYVRVWWYWGSNSGPCPWAELPTPMRSFSRHDDFPKLWGTMKNYDHQTQRINNKWALHAKRQDLYWLQPTLWWGRVCAHKGLMANFLQMVKWSICFSILPIFGGIKKMKKREHILSHLVSLHEHRALSHN